MKKAGAPKFAIADYVEGMTHRQWIHCERAEHDEKVGK